MKALVIDPFLQAIAEIDILDDLQSLYKAIGCDCFTTLRLSEHDILYLDDVGLEKPEQRFFTWQGYEQPLGGRGVVRGLSEDGGNTDTTITLEQARQAVRWADVVFSHYTHEEDTVDFFGKPMARLKTEAHFKPRREDGMTERTREEHLQWCQQRAMEYFDHGDLINAVASMTSDLEKHPETAQSSQLLGLGAAIDAADGDREAVRRYLTGFH